MSGLTFIDGEPIRVPTLERYWSDAAFAARHDALVSRDRATAHAAIDAGMAASRARQQARWAAEERGL